MITDEIRWLRDFYFIIETSNVFSLHPFHKVHKSESKYILKKEDRELFDVDCTLKQAKPIGREFDDQDLLFDLLAATLSAENIWDKCEIIDFGPYDNNLLVCSSKTERGYMLYNLIPEGPDLQPHAIPVWFEEYMMSYDSVAEIINNEDKYGLIYKQDQPSVSLHDLLNIVMQQANNL